MFHLRSSSQKRNAMRRIATSIVVILSLLFGSGHAFADNHGKDNREKKEHRMDRGSRERPGNKNHDNRDKRYDKNKKDHNHHGNGARPGNSNRPGNGYKPGPGHNNHPGNNFGPGHGQGMRPPRPGHAAAYRPTPPPPPPHPRLNQMVRYATRGCHDVDVWQVDFNTYVVRYRKGNRIFTQYIYPEMGRYGRPSLISVNWQPMAPWTLIPPIQLNINL